MGAFTFKRDPSGERHEVEVDLVAIREVSRVGVRRAAAFLGLGLKALGSEPATSVRLEGPFQMGFISEPLSAEAGAAIEEEYRAWLVGAALRELDHYFGLFLDEIWDVIRLSRTHPVVLDWSQSRFDLAFRNRTNVSRKASSIAAELQVTLTDINLEGLSLARNALAHGAGRVRERDCNSADGLELSWLALRTGAEMEGQITWLDDLQQPFVVKSQDGARLFVQVVKRETRFARGSKVRLAPAQLNEICFSYTLATDRIIGAISTRVAKAEG